MLIHSMLHIYAALAKQERRMISARTKGVLVRSYRQILVTAVPVRRRRLWADGQPVWR